MNSRGDVDTPLSPPELALNLLPLFLRVGYYDSDATDLFSTLQVLLSFDCLGLSGWLAERRRRMAGQKTNIRLSACG